MGVWGSHVSIVAGAGSIALAPCRGYNMYMTEGTALFIPSTARAYRPPHRQVTLALHYCEDDIIARMSGGAQTGFSANRALGCVTRAHKPRLRLPKIVPWEIFVVIFDGFCTLTISGKEPSASKQCPANGVPRMLQWSVSKYRLLDTV